MQVTQLLTADQCEWLITQFHTHVEAHGYSHRAPNRAVNVDQLILALGQQHPTADALRVLRYCVDSHIRTLAPQTFINYLEIVEWPTGSSQSTHLDYDYHSWTTVVYLNHTFTGGATLIDNSLVEPQQGQCVTFQGSKQQHSVLPVVTGTRYTLAVWYKSFV